MWQMIVGIYDSNPRLPNDHKSLHRIENTQKVFGEVCPQVMSVRICVQSQGQLINTVMHWLNGIYPLVLSFWSLRLCAQVHFDMCMPSNCHYTIDRYFERCTIILDEQNGRYHELKVHNTHRYIWKSCEPHIKMQFCIQPLF